MMRTADSKGTLHLGTVLKDSDGTVKAENIEKDTKGLVISVYPYRAELSITNWRLRVLTREIAHDETLARAVYRQKAKPAGCSRATTALFRIWQAADSASSRPCEVQIPYLPQLAE